MAAVFNIDNSLCVDLRAYEIISGRYQSQGDISIQLGHCLGCPLDPLHLS